MSALWVRYGKDNIVDDLLLCTSLSRTQIPSILRAGRGHGRLGSVEVTAGPIWRSPIRMLAIVPSQDLNPISASARGC